MAAIITDALIERLRDLPKAVTNPRTRATTKERHIERNYEVRGLNEEFSLFYRQSTLVPTGFSCGLIWLPPSGAKVTLARYNGADHPHHNPIERDRVDYTFHIHVATERYAAAGRKTEHYAQESRRYQTVDGALRCLLLDWNIIGIDISQQESLL